MKRFFKKIMMVKFIYWNNFLYKYKGKLCHGISILNYLINKSKYLIKILEGV